MEFLNALLEDYRLRGAPEDQQLLIALLRDAQTALGGALTHTAVNQIARAYGVPPSMIMALIRRIPSLRLEDMLHRLEICQRCGAKLASKLDKQRLAARGVEVRMVPCMKNCKNGPSLKWDGELIPRAQVQQLADMLSRLPEA